MLNVLYYELYLFWGHMYLLVLVLAVLLVENIRLCCMSMMSCRYVVVVIKLRE